MPYNFVADNFHTQKKLFSRISSVEVRFLAENGHFTFWAPFGGLRHNVRYLSWPHWKAHSGLPISVNWTFSL